jgi:hypothetical protein
MTTEGEGNVPNKRRFLFSFSNMPLVDGDTNAESKASELKQDVLECPFVERLKPSELYSWDFDIFGIAESNAYVPFLLRIFDYVDAFSFLGIRKLKFASFLSEVVRGYEDDPSSKIVKYYHNRTHCLDVTQTVFSILYGMDGKSFLPQLEIIAVLMAALCHDLEHVGVNNTFLVNTSHPMAVRYNDASVLEAYSACIAKTLMLDYRLLSNLSPQAANRFSSVVTSSILHTDIVHHFNLVGQINTEWPDIHASMSHAKKKKVVADLTPQQQSLLCSFFLHCGDISNPAKPFALAHRWTLLVMEEFFQQVMVHILSRKTMHRPLAHHMPPHTPHVSPLSFPGRP